MPKHRGLDASSSKFHDQLGDLLRGEGYQQHIPNLQSDGLAWPVDYLDEVRRHVCLPHSLLNVA